MNKPKEHGLYVLLSGYSGFVGQSVISRFTAVGCTIYGVGRTGKLDSRLSKIFEWADLPDFVESNRIDVFIHAAGKAHDMDEASSEEEYREANVELTKRFYRLFSDSCASKFIFISSIKAASDYPDTDVDELTRDCLQGYYGQTKRSAEDWVLKNKITNKRTVILRPCMIHGPTTKGNLNRLVSYLKKGLPYPFYAFENKRSYLHIDSFVEIMLKIIQSENINDGIYNVADNGAISTKDLVDLIIEEFGLKKVRLIIPRKVMIFLATIGEKIGLRFNRKVLHKITSDYVVKNDKLKKALGADVFRINGSDGLRRTIKSMRRYDTTI